MSEHDEEFLRETKVSSLREMSETERKEVMDEMSEFKEEPKVGFFWYLFGKEELFGVNKINSSSLSFSDKGLKTINTLHEDYWKKEKRRHPENPVYKRDYSEIPRGRIFQKKDGTFQLMCGSWITDKIKDLIID